MMRLLQIVEMLQKVEIIVSTNTMDSLKTESSLLDVNLKPLMKNKVNTIKMLLLK